MQNTRSILATPAGPLSPLAPVSVTVPRRQGNTSKRLAVRVMVVIALATLVFGAIVPNLMAVDGAGSIAEHVVVPGDTLWSLAETYAPQDDPRQFIYEVQRLNGLDGAGLMVGDRLLLPSS